MARSCQVRTMSGQDHVRLGTCQVRTMSGQDHVRSGPCQVRTIPDPSCNWKEHFTHEKNGNTGYTAYDLANNTGEHVAPCLGATHTLRNPNPSPGLLEPHSSF